MFIAHLKDGSVVKESAMDWKEVKKISNNFKDIKSLQVVRTNKRGEERVHTVAVKGENVDLIQLKEAVTIMGSSKPATLVERVIGFFIKEDGQKKYAVKMIIDEETGHVKLTLMKNINGQWITQ